MARSLFVISVNDGLASGSGDQHSSMSFPQSGSQRCGTGGLSVLFTIPPSSTIYKTSSIFKLAQKLSNCHAAVGRMYYSFIFMRVEFYLTSEQLRPPSQK